MVFALNTVVGFACSLGVDMGFNTKDHHQANAVKTVVHIHKDGKKHVHKEKDEKHGHADSHKHNKANNDHKPEAKKNNCCTDAVKAFRDADKAVPNSLTTIHPVFFTDFIPAYYSIALLPYSNRVKNIRYFVRSYHPPIPDIRIAIQSFQI